MISFVIPDDFFSDFVLLVGNARFENLDLIKGLRDKASGIVGVDGGAAVLKKCGIIPHLIVGDFDSVDINTLEFFKAKGTEILHIPDQNNNDLEKALRTIVKETSNLILVGFLGSRFDHTLATLFVLKKYIKKYRFFLVGDAMEVYLLKAGNYKFSTEKGQIFSIFAFNRAEGVVLKGFKYNLDSVRLLPGSLGLSNTSLGREAEIRFSRGTLIVVKNL
ncbi:MAG TPA: thiamine diphosphokinase [Candidatus Marinimicrobia bacterium]|nr:thiamine diphosphokinase [Candidatus Neomarinimicrobiota bacterium]